jgi:hypothetical protein
VRDLLRRLAALPATLARLCWLRLGISIERIRPGRPQQNGRHERMHLTLKKEATRPAGANILQRQGKFYTFIEEFNNERPHEALAMQGPSQRYAASARPYLGIPEPHYPFHDKTVPVTCCGRICLHRQKINLSQSLAGQAVGIKEVEDGSGWSALWSTIWVMSTWRIKLCSQLKIPSGQKCYLCLRNKLLPMCPVWTMPEVVRPEGFEPPA